MTDQPDPLHRRRLPQPMAIWEGSFRHALLRLVLDTRGEPIIERCRSDALGGPQWTRSNHEDEYTYALREALTQLTQKVILDEQERRRDSD